MMICVSQELPLWDWFEHTLETALELKAKALIAYPVQVILCVSLPIGVAG